MKKTEKGGHSTNMGLPRGGASGGGLEDGTPPKGGWMGEGIRFPLSRPHAYLYQPSFKCYTGLLMVGIVGTESWFLKILQG